MNSLAKALKTACGLILRVLAVSLLLGAPVYAVHTMSVEGTTKISSGTGIVLLAALQRARH